MLRFLDAQRVWHPVFFTQKSLNMKEFKPLVVLVLLCLFACKKEATPFTELTLVDALKESIHSLSNEPLNW